MKIGHPRYPERLSSYHIISWASLVAQMVKTLPVMREMQVRSLGQEDPLDKGTLTLVLLPGEVHGQRNLEGYSL